MSDLYELTICTRCGLVRDDRGGWLTQKAYREATGIDPVICRLRRDYCHACYMYYIERLQAA